MTDRKLWVVEWRHPAEKDWRIDGSHKTREEARESSRELHNPPYPFCDEWQIETRIRLYVPAEEREK